MAGGEQVAGEAPGGFVPELEGDGLEGGEGGPEEGEGCAGEEDVAVGGVEEGLGEGRGGYRGGELGGGEGEEVEEEEKGGEGHGCWVRMRMWMWMWVLVSWYGMLCFSAGCRAPQRSERKTIRVSCAC